MRHPLVRWSGASAFLVLSALFAACAAKCKTDSDCYEDNMCATYECFDGECISRPRPMEYCRSDDLCMTGRCDSYWGCVYEPKNCSGNSKCLEYECVPGIGCTTREKSCFVGDPCFVDYCSPTEGCMHVPKCEGHEPQ